MQPRWRCPVLLSLFIAAAPGFTEPLAYIQPGDDSLAQGRALWLDHCEGCHGYGVAGAPVPMQPEDWGPRLQQPVATLYVHAIEGFIGPDYSMMPARGGNDDLSDDEVRQAVDYMLFLARHYIAQATK